MIMVLLSFLILIFAGVPIVFALGVSAALTLLIESGTPSFIIAQRFYAGLDSFTIMAIPFFVLTGLIMEAGGIARRIVNLATELVGWIRGSLLMVSVMTGTGLAAISGSGSADTAAVGAMMFPEMRRRKYDLDFGAAIVAAAGVLGTIIPPSMIMIVIALAANVSIGAIFLAGIVPGLLISAGLMIVAYMHARRAGLRPEASNFSFRRLMIEFVRAVPALTLPVIIVGGIVSGYFTATEAACVAAMVGFAISLFVYRELRLWDIPSLIVKAVGISSAVMVIIATAAVFSWLIASLGVPALLSSFLLDTAGSKFMFLLFVNLLLLVVGMFMESMSAVLILVPALLPAVKAFGVDPLHFGILVSLNLSVGMLTPPYGIGLFVSSIVAQRPVAAVSRRILWPIIPMLVLLIAVTYWEDFALWLPRALM